MSVRSATTVPHVSRPKGDLRGRVEHLWETFLVGCVIADTSALDSCATCESVRPYVEETLRIRALRRLTPPS